MTKEELVGIIKSSTMGQLIQFYFNDLRSRSIVNRPDLNEEQEYELLATAILDKMKPDWERKFDLSKRCPEDAVNAVREFVIDKKKINIQIREVK